jgi:decaprenylphospho-beta-D-ribofuranose 2-oxidase
MTARTLTGWGNTAPSRAQVERPGSLPAVRDVLAHIPARGLIARGLGRSYGDAAQNGGGLVVDMTALARIHHFDPATGEIDVDAGCSLGAILERVVPAGWFLPVVPGTRFVSIGGAIACDIHGKNHHRAGSFGMHLEGLTLMTADGRMLDLTPIDAPAAFWATVGGLGLTGLITRARFRLRRIDSAAVDVVAHRVADLDSLLEQLTETDARHEYSVAWVDGAAQGRALGRGLVLGGDHAAAGASVHAPSLRLTVPRGLSIAPLLGGRPAALLNALRFRRSRSSRSRQPFGAYFFPLDALSGWNRLYGSRGFLQYQFAVPTSRVDLVRRALELLAESRITPSLSVLKRFGPSSAGLLSFPLPGWTLALDMAATPGIGRVLDRLDDEVAAAGGRVYLAKDGRLRPGMVEAMYPRLAEWRRHRAELDPDGVLVSDLARRTGLIAA